MKKKKIFKKMLNSAKEFLDNVSDDDLSSLNGIQLTMNSYLQSQGLPPVDLISSHSFEKEVEKRSFDEVYNDLNSYDFTYKKNRR